MKLSEFKSLLQRSPNDELRFAFPDGGLIEAHAHITEVGRVDKAFIDCGGTVRRLAYCSLQAWVADDTEHRLSPGKLAAVIAKAEPILGNDDLDVEIEYQDGLISQFPVEAVSSDGQTLTFHLTTKNTDCLAKELCLPAAEEGNCCGTSGCC
ncbi:MAG: DUF6428 family protein [Chthoniobacter sp.]